LEQFRPRCVGAFHVPAGHDESYTIIPRWLRGLVGREFRGEALWTAVWWSSLA
jgi:hypothetical protein